MLDNYFKNSRYELLETFRKVGKYAIPLITILLSAEMIHTYFIFTESKYSLETWMFVFFGVVCALCSAICAVVLKLGKNEYYPAILIGLILGICLALVNNVLSYLFFPNEELKTYAKEIFETYSFLGLTHDDESLLVIWKVATLINVSISGSVLYTVFTPNIASFISQKPARLEIVHVADEEAIKSILNSWNRGWALTISKMGEKVNLVYRNFLLGYTVTIESLLEKRTVTRREMAGRHATGRNFNSINSAMRHVENNRWTYNFPSSGFEEGVEKPIKFLDMSTEFSCPECYGSGNVEQKCSRCDGLGYVEVISYEPEGFERETCPACNGRGADSASCIRCFGSGCLTQYPVLICSRYINLDKKCFDPTRNRVLERVIYRAKSKPLLETKIINGIINVGDKLTSAVPAIPSEVAIKLGDEVKSIESNSRHIVKQRLKIAEIPITEIDYKYKKQLYKLWIYGYNNLIYVQNAPIHRVRLSLSILITTVWLLLNAIPVFIMYQL